MMPEPLLVHISLEYGFLSMEWVYPGTLHELFTDYAAGNVPGWGECRGEVTEGTEREIRDFVILMHVHESDDSDLRYGEWKIDPEWSTEKTAFISKLTIEGLPGKARFDAVSALALVAENAA